MIQHGLLERVVWAERADMVIGQKSDWRKELEVVVDIRQKGNEQPVQWVEQGEAGELTGNAIILAGKNKIAGLHDTPLHIAWPINQDLAQKGRFGLAESQVHFWTLLAHGFDGAAPVLKAPAKMLIKKAKERGYNAGTILISTMGAEQSAKDYLRDEDDPFGEMEAQSQLDLAIQTLTEITGGGAPVTGMIGHSMFANLVFQWLKANAGQSRRYPDMVGSIVTPVIAGPNWKGTRPAWLAEIGLEKLDGELAKHVAILRDPRSYLVRAGVKSGGIIGPNNRETVLQEVEVASGLISGLVKGYVGDGAYGEEVILPVHVREYIHNYPAIRRHVRMLDRMSLLAGDKTVGTANWGGLAPMMLVAAEGDKTLKANLMIEWARAMNLPEWGMSVGSQRSALLRDKVSGHYPKEEIWETIIEWQLDQMIARLK